jgi:hypothetical protein
MNKNKVEFPDKIWGRFCQTVRAARELFPGDTDRAVTRNLIELVSNCHSTSQAWDRGHDVWEVLHLLVTVALEDQNLPVNDVPYSEELSKEERTRRWDALCVNHEYRQVILRDCAGWLATAFDFKEIIDASRPEAGNILTNLSFLEDEQEGFSSGAKKV